MAELFIKFLGPGVEAVIDFYLVHQTIFNTVVALYGVVLVIAHRNLRTIEVYLQERYGKEGWTETLERFADDGDGGLMAGVRRTVRFPFVSSPYFFSLYRIKRSELISVVGKKHAVPRGRLGELVKKTKEGD